MPNIHFPFMMNTLLVLLLWSCCLIELSLCARMSVESLSDACFQKGDTCPDTACIDNELTYNGTDVDPLESGAALVTWDVIKYISQIVLATLLPILL